VSVGPHQVEVFKEGYEIFEQWIEVEEGQMTTVEVEFEEDPDATYGGGDDEEEDDDEEEEFDEDEDFDDDEDDTDFVLPPATTALTRHYIIFGVGPEVGNRTFQYVIPNGVTDAPNIRPYDAALVPLA